ncbi:MAG: class I SAM-dependent methyltransferase [Novosphingobium sp.]|nr:class I SAM-dependent methyltransferase [Novosphingobium sp.]
MMSAEIIAKRGYVGTMRMLKGAAASLGVLDQPASARSNRYLHWRQSLLAIYDIDALIRLDVPWWTYDSIELVEDFLNSRKAPRVFEYGSGASTVWLAKRAASVVSVDHDAGWIDFSRPRLAELGNATVELAPADPQPVSDQRYHSGKSGYRGQSFQSYVEAIDRHPGKFDLIIVDGRARAACLMQSIDRLADDGMIVFDNSHRGRYRKAIAASGLEAKVTRGLVPSLPLPDETTLLRGHPQTQA